MRTWCALMVTLSLAKKLHGPFARIAMAVGRSTSTDYSCPPDGGARCSGRHLARWRWLRACSRVGTTLGHGCCLESVAVRPVHPDEVRIRTVDVWGGGAFPLHSSR